MKTNIRLLVSTLFCFIRSGFSYVWFGRPNCSTHKVVVAVSIFNVCLVMIRLVEIFMGNNSEMLVPNEIMR